MSTTYETSRPTSTFMERSMTAGPRPLLDSGMGRLVDYMGTEDSIVQAARVSYGEGTKTAREDEALIRYLMRHRHTTPLEMCEIKVHVKLPMFVARQWVRHRTANINEMSARYSQLPAEFYVPALGRMQAQSKVNKQGSSGAIQSARNIQQQMRMEAADAFRRYNDWLDVHDLARELARINLPLSTYTEWYWKIDLHNLLHFLGLRLDPHAQYEIRVYADWLWGIVKGWVPAVAKAFEDYRLHAALFSAQELAILRRMARGHMENEASSSAEIRAEMKHLVTSHGMGEASPRERKAFWDKLGILGLAADYAALEPPEGP